MKPTKTWVVVADGARARILENLGPGKGLHELTGQALEVIVPPSREIASDRPGRGLDSAGAGRHAMTPRVDPHDQVEKEFTGALATRLNDARPRSDFDRLILIAAPRALGQLRGALSPHTAKLVSAEINKDLTRATVDDIAAHLADVAAI